MAESPLPNWFQVFGDGLRRELQELKQDVKDVGKTVDAVHEETRRTNGRVTGSEARIDRLEREASHRTAERRHRHQVFGGPMIGAIGAVVLVVVVEVVKHVL